MSSNWLGELAGVSGRDLRGPKRGRYAAFVADTLAEVVAPVGLPLEWLLSGGRPAPTPEAIATAVANVERRRTAHHQPTTCPHGGQGTSRVA